MIFNIRGTSGSGKSTLVRQTLEDFGGQPILNEKGKVTGYNVWPLEMRVLGRYETPCGGVDTYVGSPGVNGMEVVEREVRQLAADGRNALFEGLIASGVYGRWQRMCDEGAAFFWIFLDTPFEICRERVEARRAARGVARKPLNLRNLQQKYDGCLKQIESVQEAGYQYAVLDHQRAYDQLKDLLRQHCEVNLRAG